MARSIDRQPRKDHCRRCRRGHHRYAVRWAFFTSFTAAASIFNKEKNVQMKWNKWVNLLIFSHRTTTTIPAKAMIMIMVWFGFFDLALSQISHISFSFMLDIECVRWIPIMNNNLNLLIYIYIVLALVFHPQNIIILDIS